MSTQDRSRQPKGVPTGGQFAAQGRPEADVDLDSATDAQEMLDSIIYSKEPVARDDLPDIGLTDDQWQKTTGAGRRNISGCENVDTLANKFKAGALSEQGVCAEAFGLDSVQHHLGHDLFKIPPAFDELAAPTSESESEALGFTRERYGLDGPYIPGYSEVGFDRDEGFEWYRYNFGPQMARDFADAGFSPHSASYALSKSGVTTVDDAVKWRDGHNTSREVVIGQVRKLGPDSAEWARSGFADLPAVAVQWKDRGFTPAEAQEWRTEMTGRRVSGINIPGRRTQPDLALDLRDTGLPPSEAVEQWISENSSLR